MNSPSYFHRTARAAVIATLIILPAGCVVAPDGGQVSYNGGGYPGYYEPAGAYYGGWAPGYYVAPYRNNHGFEARGGNRAAVSHATPSLPSAARASVRAGLGGGGHH